MVEQITEVTGTTEPTEETKFKHQVLLYNVCGLDCEIRNLYARGGMYPNIRYIANEYDCELEFNESQFKPTGNMNYTLAYLAEFGIGSDGSCLTAFLVGNDKEKLLRAKEEIYRILGTSSFECGDIAIGERRGLLLR